MPREPRSTLFPYTTLFRSIEDHAERVDVARRGDRLAAHLLGAGIAGGHHPRAGLRQVRLGGRAGLQARPRSEEHTSELQSLRHLVCRLLLEKKKGEK